MHSISFWKSLERHVWFVNSILDYRATYIRHNNWQGIQLSNGCVRTGGGEDGRKSENVKRNRKTKPHLICELYVLEGYSFWYNSMRFKCLFPFVFITYNRCYFSSYCPKIKMLRLHFTIINISTMQVQQTVIT